MHMVQPEMIAGALLTFDHNLKKTRFIQFSLILPHHCSSKGAYESIGLCDSNGRSTVVDDCHGPSASFSLLELGPTDRASANPSDDLRT
jgi:hypothetical protein